MQAIRWNDVMIGFTFYIKKKLRVQQANIKTKLKYVSHTYFNFVLNNVCLLNIGLLDVLIWEQEYPF